MKWWSDFQHPQSWTFAIEQDKNAGFYLYIWDAKGRNTHDYLQDTFEIAQYQAFEDFGVPLDSWRPVK